jgi:hydrogenase/urease accessory protein HupE
VKAWSLLVLALVLLWPAVGRAHPQSPVTLQVVEIQDDVVAVTLRRAVAHGAQIRVEAPASCRETSASSQRVGVEQVDTITWQCDGALVGRTLALSGLRELALGALVVVIPREGATVHALIGPEDPSFVVPAEPTSPDVIARYLALGAWHLASGADHVLFVLALVLLASGWRRLLVTVTAFTLGHSLTLCGAALGWIVLPSSWAEIGIALTLVVVALQILEHRPARSTHGPALAAAFGLVHGLGFSGALADVGLPADARVAALFGFNAGLELAQLGFVLVAWPLWQRGLTRLPHRHLLQVVLAYAIGALACMWTIERLVGISG